MDDKFIQERINDLRMKKNISEYQLSLELGHSQGYIQSITSGRNLPSMSAFLDICAYFDITPSEFFNPSTNNPSLVRNIMEDVEKLSDSDLLLLSTVLKRFLELSSKSKP
ncbi:MAG: helix-turn-helix domain-containing protein [Lachnospiraceae bacterium]|nr:helix-turn-helix domain-containing protein [Lachnospiraceae bacterium]